MAVKLAMLSNKHCNIIFNFPFILYLLFKKISKSNTFYCSFILLNFSFFTLQVDVNGDITTLDLASLISQTEYDLSVTPVYDEGPGNTMRGQAITGTQLLRTKQIRQEDGNIFSARDTVLK